MKIRIEYKYDTCFWAMARSLDGDKTIEVKSSDVSYEDARAGLIEKIKTAELQKMAAPAAEEVEIWSWTTTDDGPNVTIFAEAAIPAKEQREEWRRMAGEGSASYFRTEEITIMLDAVDALEARCNDLKAKLNGGE